MGVSIWEGKKADRVAAALEAIAVAQGGATGQGMDIAGFSRLVSMGLGPKAGPVGTALTTEMETGISATVGTSVEEGTPGVTGATVDEVTFITRVGRSDPGAYEFVYDGAAWKLDGAAVELSAYGITVTGTAKAGDEIVAHVTAKEIAMNVLDHDYHTPVNGAVPHTCTVGMRDCYTTFAFDAPEALFYVDPTDYPNGLAAGQRYYIEIGYDSSAATYGNYGFTPASDVPAGGYVRHSVLGTADWTKAKALGGKFITYGADFAQIEQCATDDGETGTKLGTSGIIDGVNASTAHVNLTGRQGRGNNRLDQSNWLQWANAEGTGWFKKQNEWDFPPSGIATLKGLLTGLDPVMKASMVKVKIRVALPTIDGGGYVDVETKVFPLSMTEIGLGQNNKIYETSFGLDNTPIARALAFYTGATSADRIKTLNGGARTWFLRSAYPSSTNNVRYVGSSGALSNSYAGGANGLVAAWVIGNPVIQSA